MDDRNDVGEIEGNNAGAIVDNTLGDRDAKSEGNDDGSIDDGSLLGTRVGMADGLQVGSVVGSNE